MNRPMEEGGGGGVGVGVAVAENPETTTAAMETQPYVGKHHEDSKVEAGVTTTIPNDASSAPFENTHVDAKADVRNAADVVNDDKEKGNMETTPPVKKKRKSPAIPWKKPADMPKRPLSAYNLYFQDERKRLLLERKSIKAAVVSSVESDLLAVDSERSSATDELGTSNRSGTSWMSVVSISGNSASVSVSASPNSSRKHVTVSGLGFASLAKTVAAKWKSLDAVTKLPYEERAAQDKKRYDEQVADWREKQRKIKEAAKAAAALAAKRKKPSSSASPSTPPTQPKGSEGISPPDHHSLGSISDTYPHDWFETGTAVVPGNLHTLADEPSRTNSSSYASYQHHQQQQQQQQQQQLSDPSLMQEQQQQTYMLPSPSVSSIQQGPVNPFAAYDFMYAPPQNRFDSQYFTMQGQSSQRGGISNNIRNMQTGVGDAGGPHNQQQQQQQQQGPQGRPLRMPSLPSMMTIAHGTRSMASSLQPPRMMATCSTTSGDMSSSLHDEHGGLQFFGQVPSMAVTSFRLQNDATLVQNNTSQRNSPMMLTQTDQAGYPYFETTKMHHDDSHQDFIMASNNNNSRFAQSPFDPPSRAELGYHRPMNSATTLDNMTLMAAPANRLQLQNFQPPPTGIQQQSHMRLQQQPPQQQQQTMIKGQFQSQWGPGGGSQPQLSHNIDVNNPSAQNESNDIGLGHIRPVEEMRAEDVVKQQQLHRQHQQFLERQQRQQQQQIQEQKRRQQMLEHQRRQQLLEEHRMLQQRQLQVQQQLQQHSLQPPELQASNAGTGIRETLDDDMILFLTHLQNENASSSGSHPQQGDYPMPPPS